MPRGIPNKKRKTAEGDVNKTMNLEQTPMTAEEFGDKVGEVMAQGHMNGIVMDVLVIVRTPQGLSVMYPHHTPGAEMKGLAEEGALHLVGHFLMHVTDEPDQRRVYRLNLKRTPDKGKMN